MNRGLESYHSVRKEHYRNWVWNRLAERVKTRRDAKVLYLVGPEDIDREVARKRGFKSHNLFAVDVSGKAVGNVRGAGGIAIQEEVENVLMTWPDHVDVVYLDTCDCFTGAKLLLLMCNRAKCVNGETVIAINCMRGREADRYDHLREICKEHGWDTKHRGAWAAVHSILYWLGTCREWLTGAVDDYKKVADSLGGRVPPFDVTVPMSEAQAQAYLESDAFQITADKMMKHMKPEFYSYRSHRVVMDSIVMNGIFNYGLPGRVCFRFKSGDKICGAIRKGAAARAISTMRKEGTL